MKKKKTEKKPFISEENKKYIRQNNWIYLDTRRNRRSKKIYKEIRANKNLRKIN